MKVRILSGSQAGAVVDMEQVEAETAIATGFAESAEPKADAPEPTEEAPKKPIDTKSQKRDR